MNMNLKKLASAIDECNKHLKIISSDYGELKQVMPLTEKTFGNLNDSKTRLLDQFVFRSLKLQDAIGKRLFPELFLSLEDEMRPFIDILNRDETLGTTIPRNEWLFLIKLRNEFLHECSSMTMENAESINNLFDKVHYMYDTYITIKNYSLSKFDYLKGNASHFQTPSFPANN